MLSNFQIQTESFISGYVYAQDHYCSGRMLGYEPSLQLAQAKCDTNEECSCIYDPYCDGKYWYMRSGQSTASGSGNFFNYDCSWTKTGTVIWKFEKWSLKKLKKLW